MSLQSCFCLISPFDLVYENNRTVKAPRFAKLSVRIRHAY